MNGCLEGALAADEGATPVPDRDRSATEAEYLTPIFVFGLFTAIEPYVPTTLYPFAYAIKIAAVVVALYWARRTLALIRPSRRVIVPAVLVGLAVFLEWVVLDKLVPYPHLGTRESFDPFSALHSWGSVTSFLTIRLVGLVAIVPVMEEVFWRGFLLRALTTRQIELTQVGKFSPQAFWIVTVAFAAVHPEWLVAAFAGAAYAWLLRSSGSLFATVLAHAVTNAALAAYVLAAKDWRFW